MADTSGLDVAIAPNSSVILEPAESLTFHLQPQAAPQAVLTIRNVSDERKIAFKVKTTRPLRYLVRPNQGMLGPNGSASIMVILQQRDCDELLRLEPSERQLSNDKFLVQSIYADDSFYELVKTKSTKEMADDLTNMWAHTDKRSLSNKKLRCRFVQDDQSAGVTSAAAPGNNINNTETPLSSRFPSKSSIYSSSNSLLPTKQVSLEESSIARPNAASDAVDVSTPAQLTAALLQETEKATSKTGDATPTKKASSDAQRAKKINEDVSGSTLRQRKPGAAAGNSSDATQLSTAKGTNDPAVSLLYTLAGLPIMTPTHSCILFVLVVPIGVRIVPLVGVRDHLLFGGTLLLSIRQCQPVYGGRRQKGRETSWDVAGGGGIVVAVVG